MNRCLSELLIKRFEEGKGLGNGKESNNPIDQEGWSRMAFWHSLAVNGMWLLSEPSESLWQKCSLHSKRSWKVGHLAPNTIADQEAHGSPGDCDASHPACLSAARQRLFLSPESPQWKQTICLWVFSFCMWAKPKYNFQFLPFVCICEPFCPPHTGEEEKLGRVINSRIVIQFHPLYVCVYACAYTNMHVHACM